MSHRFRNRRVLLNKDEIYKKFMEQRNRKSVRQLDTPTFRQFSARDLRNIERIPHIWKVGDRYYKLAIRYYGAAEHWWIIALFNQKPTEADLVTGEAINIPMPLENVLRVLGS
jgi:hypothetical protein